MMAMKIGLLCLALQVPALHGDDLNTWRVKYREFLIPVRVDPNRANELQAIRLYVSVDKGKTWLRAGEVNPQASAFRYKATREGLHWFTVQVVSKESGPEPADLSTARPALIVIIDSNTGD